MRWGNNWVEFDYIIPTMDETKDFAHEAADVAMEAIQNGVARINFTREEVFNKTLEDINEARGAIDLLTKNNFIKTPDTKLLEDAIQKAIEAVK